MQTWFEKLKADFVLNFVQANRWKYLLDGLGKTLLITTGYTDTNWGKEDYFAVSPYLGVDAAEWIVEQGVPMVGSISRPISPVTVPSRCTMSC